MVAVGKMRLSLLVVGLLCVLYSLGSGGATAYAQSPAVLQTMIVSLLPQYDDPRLLIVFEAELDQPGQGYIAIPDAVELHSAEARLDDGSYQAIEAKFEGASDGRFITFTSPTRAVRLSFYQDVITQDTTHTLDFTLPAQRDALTSLGWRVIFPLGATELATTPEMSGVGEMHYGMPIYFREAGALAARTPAVQQLGWTRATSAPSFAREVTTSESTTTEPSDLFATEDGTDILAERTGPVVRSETGSDQTTQVAETGLDWFTAFRNNPIVWVAVAVFIFGLFLVLNGIRKHVARKPL